MEGSMAYDLVIRNGVVVDGTGLAAERADVGVIGDRVASVGRITERGHEEIDAEGRFVSPGFVDAHTHMDAQIFWDPLGTSSCWHGVTSVVMGNCGFTLAPARADQRRLVVANLERAEDISAEAIAQGVEWRWETFAEYVDVLDQLPKGINYGPQVGHSALRTFVMGERAFTEAATGDDLAGLDAALRDAMRAGALGFSTTRSPSHETSDDRPVASRQAEWSEVDALVHALSELGTGAFQLASEPGAQSHDPDRRADYFGRLRDLAVSSGVPVMIDLNPSRPESSWRMQAMDETAAAGGRLYGMTHSRGIAVTLSFRTRLPFDRLPEWRAFRAQPVEQQLVSLRDPAVRAALVRAVDGATYGRAIGAEARPPDYDRMFVMSAPMPPYETVASFAARRGTSPIEAMIDLAVESDYDQFFIQQIAAYDDDALVAAMRHPRAIMTFSDSGAHVSQMSDCSIQTHLLAYWVRERQQFTVEEAVRMLSLQPARAWRLRDRGVLREGAFADINVFDLDRLTPRMPELVHDLPGGARRLIQRSTGFDATVVNGQVVLRDGEPTGNLPGRVLKNRLAAA
jgi:N-acyl-D-aspartate/D-glutamate deacylase